MMILLVVPFLLIELYLSLKVGESIGFFLSAVWIFVSFVLGIYLLQHSSLAMIGNMRAMGDGKLDIKRFQNAGISYFMAAILLIVPGVFSDFLGIIALCYTLYLQFIAKITPEQKYTNSKTQGDDNVIDVEIIDEHSSREPNS